MTTTRLTLAVLGVLLLLTGGAAQAGEQRIAHVDAEALLTAMPAYKRAQSEAEAYRKQLEKGLEAKKWRLQQHYEEVMQKVTHGKLSPSQQQQEERNLHQMQEEIEKAAEDANIELKKMEARLLQPVNGAFNQALGEVARAEGYAYIIDTKTALYTAGGIDATAKVKAALGL